MTTTHAAQFTNATDAREAILAGNATITLVSQKTNARYTYRIRKAKDDRGRGPAWFVSLLTGPSNESDFTYIGMVGSDRAFRITQASRIPADTAPLVGFNWALTQIVTRDAIPATLEIWHEGRCCKCGRKLTVPASIASGIGPECARRMAA